MLRDLYLFTVLVILGAFALCIIVWRADRWLVRLFSENKPRIRRPLRVHKTKKKPYEPPIPRRRIIYPDGREEVIPPNTNHETEKL